MSLYWEMPKTDFREYQKQQASPLEEFKNLKGKGDKVIEKWLIGNAYANLNKIKNEMDKEGNTFYHMISQGMSDKNLDHIFQVQVPPVLLNMKNANERTPLFTAVLYANDYLVKKLLNEGADPTIKGTMISRTEWQDMQTGLQDVWKKNPGNISIAILDSATGDKYKIEGHCSATDKFCSRNTRDDHLISPLSISKIGRAGKLGTDNAPSQYVSKDTHDKFIKIYNSLTEKLAPCKAKGNPQGVKEEMPNYLLKAVTPEVKVHPQYGKLRY